MKEASQALIDKLKQSHDINPSTRVIAEWNLNRYASSVKAINARILGAGTLVDSSNSITVPTVHGLAADDKVVFVGITSTTGITELTTYYVKEVLSTTQFTITATIQGVVVELVTNGSAAAVYEDVEDYDEELFPVTSIVLPNRPTRGILKGWSSPIDKITGTGADGYTNPAYTDLPEAGARYYTSSVDDKYKYWVSPAESGGSGYVHEISALGNCQPTVIYPSAMQSNKIVVGIESSYAKPSAYTVQITTNGSTWTTISTSPTIPDNGRVELYLQSNGTWSSTVDRDYSIQLRGVRLVVTSMDTSRVLFNLIELSLRLESDISAYVEDYNTTNSMSDTSFVTPLGLASANSGSVALSDTEGTFTNDNPDSPYFGLLDKNVDIRIDAGTNIGTFAAPVFEWTRMATMKTDTWNGQDNDTTDVELLDDAVILQSVKPNPMLFQSMTVGEIIWRILDSVGFSNYTYKPNIREIPGHATDVASTGVFTTISDHGLSVNDEIKFEIVVSISGIMYNTSYYIKTVPTPDTFTLSATLGGDPVVLVGNGYIRLITTNRDNPSALVPYFWTDGESTVWQVINELTQATQTAVYFDEYNMLQIKTRSAAYDLARSVDWTFNAEASGVTLPDIVDLKKTYEYEANVANISYFTTKISDEANGIPVMETVWEPGQEEGSDSTSSDLVLRAAPLITSMTATATIGQLDLAPMASWPFTGIIQIEGEFIRYKRKGYCWYTETGTLYYGWVASEDEKKAKDKLNPALAYKNRYTGWLDFGAENRGLWNSVPKAHSVDITGYIGRYRTLNGGIRSWRQGIFHDKPRGALRLSTAATFTPNTWLIAARSNYYDQGPYYYGTRLMFPTSGYRGGSAGIIMGMETNDSGYHIEINRTTIMGSRKYTNEICFYVRYSDGHIVRFGPNGGKGNVMAISNANWYDVDVAAAYVGGGAIRFNIAVNGVQQMTVTVPSGAKVGASTLSGRYGLFARGDTIAYFEYLYSSTYAQYEAFDDEGYFDRISGGYQSSQLMREWTYNLRRSTRVIKGRRKLFTQKYNQTMIDEFGPVAHEVREYDVKFSKSPVVHSSLYLTNETQIICPEYNGNAFRAKFIIANTARTNAVSNGEDTMTFGADNAVTQHTLIYGRTVTASDEEKHTVKDASGISRRGEISVDISSKWIQSEASAKVLGEWIITHWGTGQDEISITIFGNPLIQLGDLIAINYAAQHMAEATHRYFVVKVDQSHSNGLDTTVVARRAKI